MHLRWTEDAADDLEHIADYLLTIGAKRQPPPIPAAQDIVDVASIERPQRER
jgi:plasmid stabilization system protein ParE